MEDHTYSVSEACLATKSVELVVVNEDNVYPATSDNIKKKHKMTDSDKYNKIIKIKEIKNQKQAAKHRVIKKSCTGKCSRQCLLLSDEHQVKIWSTFWSLNYTDRRKYISKCVTILPVKRRTTTVNNDYSYKKNQSRNYTLKHPDLNVEIAVCKTTLLQTLGYTNDSVLTELVGVMNKDSHGKYIKENRGRSGRDVIDRETIIKHIESFIPYISHCKKHNSLNHRYLPRELTIKSMFKDFSSENPGYCNIETYRTTLKRLKYESLNQSKADDCEDCLNLTAPLTTTNNKTNLELIDNKYKADSENRKDSQTKESNLIEYCSMDLQELIPFMPNTNYKTSSEESAELVVVGEDNVYPAVSDNTLKKRKMTDNDKYDKITKIKEIKNQKQAAKHPVIKKSCTGKCSRQCLLLSNEHQIKIWSTFWSLNYTDRRKYLSKCVTILPVKRRTTTVNNDYGYKKKQSRIYTLKHPDLNVDIAVCQKTLLQTLGYTNDSVLVGLVSMMNKDSCGKYVKENRGNAIGDIIDREIIIRHIESFNPRLSHCRKHSSTNFRYLPREVNIKSMFKDFLFENPGYCTLQTYRNTMKRLNVSLNQFTNGCEDCLLHK